MSKESDAGGHAAGRSVLPLKGEIDLHISPQIAASLREMVAAQPAQLLIDLSNVTYVDSSGLAVFIETMQSVAKYGGEFGLVGMQATVRSIFEMARLDQVFRIFPSLAEASLAA